MLKGLQTTENENSQNTQMCHYNVHLEQKLSTSRNCQ
jgi:hypothetical protein